MILAQCMFFVTEALAPREHCINQNENRKHIKY